MKRVLFIYNRHAGKNKTWAGLSNLINAMTEEDCLVTAYPTQYRGDAGEAIVRWSKDFDQVVVAGGDGTLSEAIAGAVRLNEQPIIGYIPVGTTNDFSKNLNLPLGDLTALAATAVTGVPHTHDLGRFNGQSFLYVAAFGAFTEIAYSTPQKAKNLLGYNAYVLEVVKNLASIKPYHLKVEYDDNVIEGDFLYGMVSNTVSVGGLMNLPRDVVKLDEQHHVCGPLQQLPPRKPGPLRRPAGGDPHLPRPGREGHGGIQPRPADDQPLHSQLHDDDVLHGQGQVHRRPGAALDPGRRGRRGPPGGRGGGRPQRLYHHPRPRKTAIKLASENAFRKFRQITCNCIDFLLA